MLSSRKGIDQRRDIFHPYMSVSQEPDRISDDVKVFKSRIFVVVRTGTRNESYRESVLVCYVTVEAVVSLNQRIPCRDWKV